MNENNQLNNKKTSKSIVKIIVIILSIIILCVIVVCSIGWFIDTKLFPKKDEYKITYQVNDINNMYDETLIKYSSNDISNDNLKAFNILLKYVDKEIGKNNYYLASLYEVNYGEIDTRYPDKVQNYIIKVVPKEYENQFIEYGKDESDNPYLVMYKLNANSVLDINNADDDNYYDDFVESYYPSLIVGLKYEKQINDYFLKVYPNYKVKVWYNPYFTGLRAESVDSKPDISVYEKYYSTSIYIFVPYGTNTNEIKQNLDRDKLKDMGINNITICSLRENININDLNKLTITEFSEEIDKTEQLSTLDIN